MTRASSSNGVALGCIGPLLVMILCGADFRGDSNDTSDAVTVAGLMTMPATIRRPPSPANRHLKFMQVSRLFEPVKASQKWATYS